MALRKIKINLDKFIEACEELAKEPKWTGLIETDEYAFYLEAAKNSNQFDAEALQNLTVSEYKNLYDVLTKTTFEAPTGPSANNDADPYPGGPGAGEQHDPEPDANKRIYPTAPAEEVEVGIPGTTAPTGPLASWGSWEKLEGVNTNISHPWRTFFASWAIMHEADGLRPGNAGGTANQWFCTIKLMPDLGEKNVDFERIGYIEGGLFKQGPGQSHSSLTPAQKLGLKLKREALDKALDTIFSHFSIDGSFNIGDTDHKKNMTIKEYFSQVLVDEKVLGTQYGNQTDLEDDLGLPLMKVAVDEVHYTPNTPGVFYFLIRVEKESINGFLVDLYSTEKGDPLKAAHTFLFSGAGFHSKLPTYGHGPGKGLTAQIDQLCQYLEQYAIAIEHSEIQPRIKTGDLRKQAEMLRAFPKKFDDLIYSNINVSVTGNKLRAGSLSESAEIDASDNDVSHQYQIGLDEDFKPVHVYEASKGDPMLKFPVGVKNWGQQHPISNPTSMALLFYAKDIFDTLGTIPIGTNEAMFKKMPPNEFCEKYIFPEPEGLTRISKPATDAVLGISQNLFPGPRTKVYKKPGQDKISDDMRIALERNVDNLYHKLGGSLLGGDALGRRMQRIENLEDFFKLILNKISIAEIVKLAFLCISKYSDLADYLDQACNWVLEHTNLKQIETEVMPELKEKKPEVYLILKEKIDKIRNFSADAIGGVVANNSATKAVEKADQNYMLNDNQSNQLGDVLENEWKKQLGMMSRSGETGTAICLAILLVIPALFELFTGDIDWKKVWKDMKARWEVFILDDFPITDFLKAIGDAIIQLTLNILRDVLVQILQVSIDKIIEKCGDSAEDDLAGAPNADEAYGRASINDLLNQSTPDQADDAAKQLFGMISTDIDLPAMLTMSDFFDELSSSLTINQLCSAVSGEPTVHVMTLARVMLDTKYPNLAKMFPDQASLENLFSLLSKFINPSLCIQAAEEYESIKIQPDQPCCVADILAPKYEALSKQVSPEFAQKQLEKDRANDMNTIRMMIPFMIGEPFEMPPIFCTPETPDGLIDPIPPSVGYSLEHMADSLYSSVIESFNSDIDGYKRIITDKMYPWQEDLIVQDAESGEARNDAAGAWIDIVTDYILMVISFGAWGDAPKPKGRSPELTQALIQKKKQEGEFVAWKVRDMLQQSANDISIEVARGDDGPYGGNGAYEFEGFTISFPKPTNKKLVYYHNTNEEEMFIPVHAPGPFDAAKPNWLSLKPNTYMVSLIRYGPQADATESSLIAVADIIDGEEIPRNTPDVIHYGTLNPGLVKTFIELISEGPLNTAITDSDEISYASSKAFEQFLPEVLGDQQQQLYESLMKKMYARFIERSAENGLYNRRIFNKLKLTSYSPADPKPGDIIGYDAKCNPVYAPAVEDIEEFLELDKIKEMLQKRVDEIGCGFDTHKRANSEIIVLIMVRVIVVEVFLKCLFTFSIFPTKTVYANELIKKIIADEIRETMQRPVLSNITGTRIYGEMQKHALNIVNDRIKLAKAEVKKDAEGQITKVDFNNVSEFGGLNDPITGEPVDMNTGLDALVYLAQEQVDEIFNIFMGRMKYISAEVQVLGKGNTEKQTEILNHPSTLFDHIAEPGFKKLPSSLTVDEVPLPKGQFQTGPASYVVGNFTIPTEDLYAESGLYFETYIKVVPKNNIEAYNALQEQGVSENFLEHFSWLKNYHQTYKNPTLFGYIGKLSVEKAISAYGSLCTNPLGPTLFMPDFVAWNRMSNMSYTDFFEPITAGVRLVAAFRQGQGATDDVAGLDFGPVEEKLYEYLSEVASKNATQGDGGYFPFPGNGSNYDYVFRKLTETLAKEKVFVMGDGAGNKQLIIPLAEEEQMLFPEDTHVSLSQAFDCFHADKETKNGMTLAQMIKPLSVQITRPNPVWPLTELEIREKIITENKELLDNIFRMDKLLGLMASHHLFAFKQAYPELGDVFQRTKLQLGQLLNIFGNISERQAGNFKDPTLEDLEPGEKPFWDEMEVSDIWKKIPLMLLECIVTMIDPVWKTPWFRPGPITAPGVAMKLLMTEWGGDDADAEQEKLECEERARLNKITTDQRASAIEAAKNAAAELAAGGANYWQGLEWEIKFDMLNFHMEDIVKRYTISTKEFYESVLEEDPPDWVVHHDKTKGGHRIMTEASSNGWIGPAKGEVFTQRCKDDIQTALVTEKRFEEAIHEIIKWAPAHTKLGRYSLANAPLGATKNFPTNPFFAQYGIRSAMPIINSLGPTDIEWIGLWPSETYHKFDHTGKVGFLDMAFFDDPPGGSTKWEGPGGPSGGTPAMASCVNKIMDYRNWARSKNYKARQPVSVHNIMYFTRKYMIEQYGENLAGKIVNVDDEGAPLNPKLPIMFEKSKIPDLEAAIFHFVQTLNYFSLPSNVNLLTRHDLLTPNDGTALNQQLRAIAPSYSPFGHDKPRFWSSMEHRGIRSKDTMDKPIGDYANKNYPHPFTAQSHSWPHAPVDFVYQPEGMPYDWQSEKWKGPADKNDTWKYDPGMEIKNTLPEGQWYQTQQIGLYGPDYAEVGTQALGEGEQGFITTYDPGAAKVWYILYTAAVANNTKWGGYGGEDTEVADKIEFHRDHHYALNFRIHSKFWLPIALRHGTEHETLLGISHPHLHVWGLVERFWPWFNFATSAYKHEPINQNNWDIGFGDTDFASVGGDTFKEYSGEWYRKRRYTELQYGAMNLIGGADGTVFSGGEGYGEGLFFFFAGNEFNPATVSVYDSGRQFSSTSRLKPLSIDEARELTNKARAYYKDSLAGLLQTETLVEEEE